MRGGRGIVIIGKVVYEELKGGLYSRGKGYSYRY